MKDAPGGGQGSGKDLNEGLDYVKDLPGYERGNPQYFEDPMTDRLLEICLQLAGEIWVNRDRQMVMEHLLATEGKVTPEMIEQFKPDPDMKDKMKQMRRNFTARVFSSLYSDFEGHSEAAFLSGVVKDEG